MLSAAQARFLDACAWPPYAGVHESDRGHMVLLDGCCSPIAVSLAEVH
jgi:hypothetical protein